MSSISILFDGWALAYDPGGPAAIHLHSLFDYLPDDVQAYLALPIEGIAVNYPRLVKVVRDDPDLSQDHSKWIKRVLPKLARELHVDLQHLVGAGPALFGSGVCLVSPAGYTNEGYDSSLPGMQTGGRGSLVSRWQQALAHGGMARAAGIAWPEDLPVPKGISKISKLPPALPAVFVKENIEEAVPGPVDLPESYVIYHGPMAEADLRRLLDTWSWAMGAIGEYFPLLILGANLANQDLINRLQVEYQTGSTALVYPEIPVSRLPAIYKQSTAILHPAGVSAWGDPLRLALACGKPIVAIETSLSDALVGSAAYLVSSLDTYQATCRALGAALVSVVVDESLAEALSEAARQRSLPWKQAGGQFSLGLSSLYAQLISKA